MKCFDFDLLAERNGVACDDGHNGPLAPKRENAGKPAPVKQTGPIKRYAWARKDLPIAIAAAKQAAAEKEPLRVCGGAMPWLLGAAIANMTDVVAEFQVGDEVKAVFDLPQGAYNPAGEVQFQVTERDGKTFVSYECDDPSKPFTNGHHNYDLTKLKDVVLPELKEGTHLYLKTSSYFYVLAVFLKSWVPKCDSVSIYDMFTDSYVCGYAKDETLIGKEEKA